MPNRDLNPHKAARVAMLLWNREYAQQSLGSMGFWDSLPEPQKNVCRELLEKILSAPDENAHASKVVHRPALKGSR
jgi:hypothetical protein